MSGADQLVTGLTLGTVLIARHGLASTARQSAVSRRLRSLHGLIAALLLCRIASPVIGGILLTAVTMVLAAWLPLAALRLVEELTRRHARRSVKLFALGGAISLSVVAATVGLVWSVGAILVLAGFQAMMLLVMASQLLTSRRELGEADGQTAGAILAALLLAVPLILTDFRALFPDLDVRGGSFAILLLVLATSTAGTQTHALRRFSLDSALLLFAGAIALFASDLAGAPSAIEVAGPVAALAALFLVVERAGTGAATPPGIAAALVRSAESSRDGLLAAHPLLASGQLLGPADLSDFPAETVKALLRYQVTSIDAEDPDVRALAGELLLSHRATHLIRLNRDPPELLAVEAGELASPRLSDELTVAGRLMEQSREP